MRATGCRTMVIGMGAVPGARHGRLAGRGGASQGALVRSGHAPRPSPTAPCRAWPATSRASTSTCRPGAAGPSRGRRWWSGSTGAATAWATRPSRWPPRSPSSPPAAGSSRASTTGCHVPGAGAAQLPGPLRRCGHGRDLAAAPPAPARRQSAPAGAPRPLGRGRHREQRGREPRLSRQARPAAERAAVLRAARHRRLRQAPRERQGAGPVAGGAGQPARLPGPHLGHAHRTRRAWASRPRSPSTGARPGARASRPASPPASGRSGCPTTLVDARTLTHGQVNQRIGAPGDTVMTPPLLRFLKRLPRPLTQILLRSRSFLPITMRWISEVPSPISSSGASR